VVFWWVEVLRVDAPEVLLLPVAEGRLWVLEERCLDAALPDLVLEPEVLWPAEGRLADEGLLVPAREREGVLECDPVFLVPERARVEPDFLCTADLGVREPDDFL
jgi:hypothetical protein